MKEGSFTAGYVDAAHPLDDPDTSKRIFASVRESMEQSAKESRGKFVSEREVQVNKHQGRELRFEFSGGSVIYRVHLVSRRVYQVAAMLKSDQQVYERIAVNVLDSFKILSEEEVATARKELAAKAQPSPLPQEPLAPRVGSDAQDEGLRGRVKTVFTESQDLSGTWTVQTRKPNSMDYYNEHGNLTKKELYDHKGNLSDITSYGYLDGARVSDFEGIRHEYNPPPMMVGPPPGEAKPTYDPRYSYKFTFKYDDKKRLTEKTRLHNNGKLWLRYVYNYSGNQREDLVYSADGSLNQRYLVILDDKGNEVEETIFETRDGSVRSKLSYAYEFDSHGNWTKRTSSKLVMKDEGSRYEPQAVYYRGYRKFCVNGHRRPTELGLAGEKMTKDKSIDNELIDNLLKNYKKPEDLIGENGLLRQLTKQLLERAMAAELTEHVGYDKHDAAGNNSGNSRNGKSAKMLKGTFGELALETPRDRNGTFEPQIIEKHQTRFTGFDKNILSLYSRGLSTREIQQHLEEIYGVEVTAGLISSVTDEVLDEVKTWQNRQLDAIYRSCTWTRSSSKSETTDTSGTKQSTWRLGSRLRDTKKCWGYGLRKQKGQSSGCK